MRVAGKKKFEFNLNFFSFLLALVARMCSFLIDSRYVDYTL